jgi:hypothetical protein
VEWPTGPINMNFPPSARLRAVSLCVVLIIPLLFPAVWAQKGAPPTAVFVDMTRAAGIDFHLTCGKPQKLYIDSMM